MEQTMMDEPLMEVMDARADAQSASQMAAKVLEEAENSPASSTPPMPRKAPDSMVTLPTGGTAEVRELTGADEERIARIPMKDFVWKQRDAIVRAGLVAIEDEPVDPKNLPDLLVGDRESILLAIRIATYGPQMDHKVICPQCESTQEIVLNLDEIEHIPLEGSDTREVELRDGAIATIVLPRASTEDEALKMASKGKTGADINTRLIAESVLSVQGRGPWLGDASARELGLADRKALLAAITDVKVGPKYDDLEAECTDCGHRASLDVTLADLFRG